MGNLKKGNEIKFVEKVDLKNAFIRLKENESIKVRLLVNDAGEYGDYVEYASHGAFDLKVYSQPCSGEATCPLCIASKAGEPFDKLYIKKRYLFAFACLDTGDIKFWDASKGQAKALLNAIAEYKEELSEVAFNFKRTGNKTETTYSLNPILKMKGDDKTKFEAFNDKTGVDIAVFESVLQPKSEELLQDVLSEAGFPMAEYFPGYKAKAVDTDTEINF